MTAPTPAPDLASPPVQTLERLRLWHRFHVRLTVIFGGAVLLTILIVGLTTYQVGVETEVDGLRARLKSIVTSLAETIPADAIAQVPASHDEMTDLHLAIMNQFQGIAQSDPDIDSIYILRPTLEPTKLRFFVDYAKREKRGTPGEPYSAKGLPVLLRGFEEIAVEEKPYVDRFGLTLSGYAPLIASNGTSIGVVGVDVLVERIQILKKRVATATLWQFGIAFTLVVLMSWLVARSIRNPLNLMIRATTAISRGELDTRLMLNRHDEFGVLAKHFDHMAQDLKEREFVRDTFGRYVSEEVARSVLAGGVPNLGGEERVVTVLFIDIKGYTTISEGLSPVQTVDMLNRYLGAMSDVIDAHHGCVIEFLGDAILAVFGAPHYYPEHAEKALDCALAMRDRLEELNTEWRDAGLALLWQKSDIKKIEARIGVHTGPVVVGNLGGRSRIKYAVIGDSVNVASRIEGLNKVLNTTILVSDDVKCRLPAQWAERLHDHGDHAVKGRRQTVRIYSI